MTRFIDAAAGNPTAVNEFMWIGIFVAVAAGVVGVLIATGVFRRR